MPPQISEGYEGTNDVAPITDRRSTAEVYRTFYKLFAAEEITAPSGEKSHKSMLWDGRALRVDELNDSSTHLVVRLMDCARVGRNVRTIDSGGRPETHTLYDAMHLMVVSTDGNEITPWYTQRVRSIYKGYFGGEYGRFKPENEVIIANLALDGVAGTRELTFNRGTKNGTIEMPNGYVGWILSKAASEADLQMRLSAEESTTAQAAGW